MYSENPTMFSVKPIMQAQIRHCSYAEARHEALLPGTVHCTLFSYTGTLHGLGSRYIMYMQRRLYAARYCPVQPYFQAGQNRKRKLESLAAPSELRLHDFIRTHRAAAPAASTASGTGPGPASALYLQLIRQFLYLYLYLYLHPDLASPASPLPPAIYRPAHRSTRPKPGIPASHQVQAI